MESSSHHSLNFFLGGGDEARTRLALKCMPKSGLGCLLVPSRSSNVRLFRDNFSSFFSDGEFCPVIAKPLNPSSTLADLMSTAGGASMPQITRVHIERIEARLQDVNKILCVLAELADLALEKKVTVSCGVQVFAESDYLLLEQLLFDLGLSKTAVVTCWLNGLGDEPVRYIRCRADSLSEIQRSPRAGRMFAQESPAEASRTDKKFCRIFR